jgi:hypothetical protein
VNFGGAAVSVPINRPPHSEQAMVDIPKRNLLVKLSTTLFALPASAALARAVEFALPASPAPQQTGGIPMSGQEGSGGKAPGQYPQDETTNPKTPAELDPKLMLKEHQKKIRDDVEKLYDLAGDLKDEVEKTQTEHVLSLPMIQKAEQIEKLAKQIKTFARGD